jgi:DHA3 family tetracycline resistance protein-like MFS transporter
MTHVYVRAEQLGLLSTIAGSVASGLLASVQLRLPLLAGGALGCLLAAALAVLMPERHFQRPGDGGARSARALLRGSARQIRDQAGTANRAIRAVPGLVLLFAMTFFTGLWSESFDRLWGAFLLKDIRFPHLLGLRPAMWFSVLAVMAAVLALGTTELAGRRTRRLGPGSVTSTLLAVTAAMAILVVIMGTARAFSVAVAAYLLISALRPASGPLLTGWMVVRLDARVRATALSARDMFDSGGQIVGGPAIGLIGNLVSIRAALLAGAAALGPALGLLAAASRKVRARTGAPAPGTADDGGPPATAERIIYEK